MSEETELKLDLAAGAEAAVRSSPLLSGAPTRTKRQLSIYFDTPGRKLAKQGCTLRLRLVEEQWIQTVKLTTAAGGLFERSEWEWAVAGDRPELKRLAEVPVELGSPDKLARKLEPTLQSEVERTSWQVDAEGSRVQVDLDVGTLTAGNNSTRVEEVEFELLDGPAEAVVQFGRQVAEQVPARLGVLSKADRGAALMDGTLGAPVRASPVAVTGELTVAQAFAAIVHACLRHYRLNEEVVIEQRDPTALHQGRVALRRLRSAFTLFKPAIGGDPHFQELREELRWFTNQLGDARNLDVFLTRDLPPDEQADASNRREGAYDQVVTAMTEPRSRLLVIDLTAWAAIGDWRHSKRAKQPIGAFADKRLDRLWGTVEPTGRSLARMTEESRHELRIQIKKMRYAVEFFHRLHPETKVKKRFGVAVEQLQEALGKLNDLATARTISSGEGSGWLGEQSEELSWLGEAEVALKALGKAGPFWRTSAEGSDNSSTKVRRGFSAP